MVMGGVNEPKRAHQLQVVRMAQCVLQHPGEVGCSDTKQTRRHCMCTRTRIGQQTVSCTVERHGLTAASHNNRWLHFLFSGEAEYLRHCQGHIEANLADLGTVRDAIDHYIRQQCSMRTSFSQRVVETRIVSQERISIGVGRHVAELGGHWNESTHV